MNSRKKFWIRSYVASLEKDKNELKAFVQADFALSEFDKRFTSGPIITPLAINQCFICKDTTQNLKNTQPVEWIIDSFLGDSVMGRKFINDEPEDRFSISRLEFENNIRNGYFVPKVTDSKPTPLPLSIPSIRLSVGQCFRSDDQTRNSDPLDYIIESLPEVKSVGYVRGRILLNNEPYDTFSLSHSDFEERIRSGYFVSLSVEPVNIIRILIHF